MGATVEVDLSGVIDKIGPRGLLRGLRSCTTQIVQTANPYIPMRKGLLRHSAVVTGQGELTLQYRTPYARKQYHTQFGRYTTPGTGPKWIEVAGQKHGETWAIAFLEGMLRG